MANRLSTPRAPRALLVEDDDDLRSAVTAALVAEGFEVRGLSEGAEVVDHVETFRPDIVVLDVGLPNGLDGFTVAQRIRRAGDVPFLFVTGAGRVEDRLTGFEVGGDDYLVKPFTIAELLARVRAILRRTDRLKTAVWRVGDIVVDVDAHTVLVADQPVELTAIEFSLLVTLARNPRRVMSKVQLLNEVWGADHFALNLVEVHVSALRRKLEVHAPRSIHTVRGVGYVLRP